MVVLWSYHNAKEGKGSERFAIFFIFNQWWNCTAVQLCNKRADAIRVSATLTKIEMIEICNSMKDNLSNLPRWLNSVAFYVFP